MTRRFVFPNVLTEREFAVVEELLRGKSAAEIARALNTEPRAIENLITRIYRKLEVSGKKGLISKFERPFGVAHGPETVDEPVESTT